MFTQFTKYTYIWRCCDGTDCIKCIAFHSFRHSFMHIWINVWVLETNLCTQNFSIIYVYLCQQPYCYHKIFIISFIQWVQFRSAWNGYVCLRAKHSAVLANGKAKRLMQRFMRWECYGCDVDGIESSTNSTRNVANRFEIWSSVTHITLMHTNKRTDSSNKFSVVDVQLEGYMYNPIVY